MISDKLPDNNIYSVDSNDLLTSPDVLYSDDNIFIITNDKSNPREVQILKRDWKLIRIGYLTLGTSGKFNVPTIYHVWVKEQYRNEGLATKLYEYIFELLKDNGVKYVVSNSGSQRLSPAIDNIWKSHGAFNYGNALRKKYEDEINELDELLDKIDTSIKDAVKDSSINKEKVIKIWNEANEKKKKLQMKKDKLENKIKNNDYWVLNLNKT